MSDPLSIAAGVVGVVTAAAQISLLLTKFTKSTIAAPQQAKVVLAEVSDISVILTQLQSYLLGLESPNSSRASLLKVEKVVTIVSGCVLTFSELEKLLDELKTEGLDVLDCLKWARKESAMIGLVQRLQNNKSSLSVILNILNGHTITEAKNSVDRLHHLVEQGYSEISSRVQALEVLSLQKDNPSWTSKDDTESLATIRAHRPDLSAEEIMESGLEHFDFLDELQRSRVYQRNEAFRTSVISAITNSMYSLGWSFFSDLSMAEVSNISVMNLAVFEGEVYNPGRTSQTWSAQSGRVTSTDDHLDGQSTQLYKVGHGPVQADTSAAIARGHWPASTQTQQRSLSWTRSPLPRLHPLERRRIRPHWEQRLEDEESTRNAEILDPTSTLSPADVSDPLSPPQPKTSSSPQSHEGVEDGESYVEQDEAAYPCKGCGEILEEGKAWELAGNRWHIDCFRCNTCGTILDSDANLLLCGDGSLICGDGLLICNNCTYSCSVCNNKIEDLAILIGDQAFCATCFKCRNCKKKIEFPKCARTSQGIFCMECHADRRHRRKAAVMNAHTEQTTPMSPTKVQNQKDKGMPALPLEATWELRDQISKAASASSDPNTATSPSIVYPSVFF